MNYGQNLLPKLTSLSIYKSPMGGSRNPAITPKGHLLFEIIQEGAVYGFESDPVLHGEGSVFCHHGMQPTVSDSPDDGYYNCVVAIFKHGPSRPHSDHWPRYFQWKDWQSMHRFIDEMFYAFHQTNLNRVHIGNHLWSKLCLERDQFLMQEKMRQVHPQLRIATDYINRNYFDDISLDQMAEAAGISVSHLHMLFRDHLNESPHQFLIQKRMRMAAHALATGNQPIKAIAAEVGYPNVENFCRAFRKYFETSASVYRQAYRTKERG